ncbi:MAG: tyrosinase family protein [Chitinophagaceae bacterium]
MNFILKVNGSESPKAAYIGWTPVTCTLAIEGYDGGASLPVTITTGHDNLNGQIRLYDSNAPSAEPIDKIEHDFQARDELTFYVAGKYPHASVAKKDTFIKVESNNNDVPALNRNIMVRVRKNANRLKPEEIEKVLTCFMLLSKSPPKEKYADNGFTAKPGSLLDEIVLMHTYDAATEIHGRTSFHPWHRAFQMHLEREMQQIDPAVTIPYWKFDEGAEMVFTPNFVGETKKSNSPATGPADNLRPKFDQTNPLYSYSEHTLWGPLRRAYAEGDPATGKPSERIFDESEIIRGAQSSDRFVDWSSFEERRSHNRAHTAFTGHVVDVGRDPVDLLFFMMHGNVDRLWALWQQEYNRFDGNAIETYPFQGSYQGTRGQAWAVGKVVNEDSFYEAGQGDVGNFVEDTLWPWDLDQQLSRPMRKWNNVVDPHTGKGDVPQINIKFPNSDTSAYPKGPLTVKSTIDYQERIGSQTPLGFDYDKIPYFEHDKKPIPDVIMATSELGNADFFNKALSIPDRLRAADQRSPQEKDVPTTAINILRDKEEVEAIRLKSVNLIDETSEAFLDAALDIIADENEPLDLRSQLIHEVFAAKRFNRYFPSRKPRFFNILRGLIKHKNQKLRFQAIEILAAHNDDVVQDFLIEEIRKDQSEFISKPDAIFFLRQNNMNQHSRFFRDLFEQSQDPEIRKAAIEGLDNDPNYIDLLKEVVLDNQESFKVREAGALSLHHIDPELMNELASEIIAAPAKDNTKLFLASFTPDPSEVDFKAGLLNMLTYTGDINRLKQNEDLKTSLRDVVDPANNNKANFRGSFEITSDKALGGPTIIEQMATKLLRKFEATDENE